MSRAKRKPVRSKRLSHQSTVAIVEERVVVENDTVSVFELTLSPRTRESLSLDGSTLPGCNDPQVEHQAEPSVETQSHPTTTDSAAEYHI